VVKGQKLSKRKKEFELAKAGIFAHLNLTKKLELGQGGKLLKNLDTCRKANEKLANARAAINRAKETNETVPSLRELLKMKESCVNPLNYSCEFSRLT
jgi:uncharacterized protein YgiB involved in biofilm formation